MALSIFLQFSLPFKDNNQTAPWTKHALLHYCVSKRQLVMKEGIGNDESNWKWELRHDREARDCLRPLYTDRNGHMKTAKCELRVWFKSLKKPLVGISKTPSSTQPAFTNHSTLSRLLYLRGIWEENHRQKIEWGFVLQPTSLIPVKICSIPLAAVTFSLITFFSSAQETLLIL